MSCWTPSALCLTRGLAAPTVHPHLHTVTSAPSPVGRHPDVLKADPGGPKPDLETVPASLLIYDPATWRGSTPREYLAAYLESQQVCVWRSIHGSFILAVWPV